MQNALELEQVYFPRDLSWLSFNYRVLKEAADPDLPLYERLKFLAIYSSNLDEFFRVRVASLQSLLAVKKKKRKKWGLAPQELLERIQAEVFRQQEEFGEIFRGAILPGLAAHGIHLLRKEPQTEAQIKFIGSFFVRELMPYLHTELLLKNRIVHFLRDGALYLAVSLLLKPLGDEPALLTEEKRRRYAIIQIPTHYFPRFIELPSERGSWVYMFLDDIVRLHLYKLFPGFEVTGCYSIKLSRNADLNLEEEISGDLRDKILKSLSKRQVGVPARFLYDQEMPEPMLGYLRESFGLSKREIIPGGRYHNFTDFFGFPNPLSPQLEIEAIPPLCIAALDDADSMFDAIRAGSRILHFPYQSYDYVIRFLKEAARDPAVTHIKTTQYRVASHSAVVAALIQAAQNGKDVTVFVELKARFDEAANLKSARDMEAAGVKIFYGLPGLKVHAKVALVLRDEGGKSRGFAFLSTGNFNEKTARVYADHGYFTADQGITRELEQVFLQLTGEGEENPRFEKLLVAPYTLRDRFEAMIDREIVHARAGRAAAMILKFNNLEDPAMIAKLSEASMAGVEVTLILRGICCLRPGLPGLTENISVRRIVDRFLEHARVFFFHNDGEEEMYLASADWMTRNLSRRIEVSFPIGEQHIRDEIMEIIRLQLRDNTKAVMLDSELNNILADRGDDSPHRSQMETYFLLAARAGKQNLTSG